MVRVVKLGGLNGAITKIFTDGRADTLVRANRALRAVVVQNWGDVIKSTPVDTGRARGNWFVTQIAPSNEESNIKDKTKTRGPALVLTKTNDKMFGTKWFLTNNLPYILTLEFGGYPSPVKDGTWNKKKQKFEILSVNGFSKQAPAGMVRINLVRFPAQLARAFKGAF